MNHRDAGAFERRASPEAPTPPKAPAPSTVSGTSAPSAKPRSEKVEKVEKVEEAEEGILVVVSKVKAYIRRRSGMNTSDAVMEVLSRWIRKELDDSIRRAAQADRKTLLDRDIHPGPF